MREVRSNETILDWSDTPESTAAIWWDNTTHLVVKVFLNDKTESIGKPAAVDGAAGAGGGAAIGGILAGVFTGGLGIPAGAGIGALIGGLAGGTAGGATGALSANDRVLFEVDCSGAPGFPLDGSVEYAVESLGEKHTASVRFNLLEVKAPVQNGGLELGEKYIVRMHSVHLSERAALKGENNPDDARYYVVLEQGANEYSFHEDEPLILPPGINTNPGIVTVLKNTGEETRLRIYEQDFLRDDLVFSAKIAKIDGKSWVFIGKAVADDTSDSSYALFETFGPLK
ncbi:MAG TPA: hypothetical protein PLO37_15650 [Candidatus Hydrogenedentes bacterium]|nr:hypothetical protein [Candidatus Hydrogenedentota bacterium]HPG68281.1 hypothetical protein [Candidatus Hydrogenedentota bacterium]